LEGLVPDLLLQDARSNANNRDGPDFRKSDFIDRYFVAMYKMMNLLKIDYPYE
jgi:hypothetical protein